jgi:hypothetical protein
MEEERAPSWISAVTDTKNLAIPLLTYLATAQLISQESRRCLLFPAAHKSKVTSQRQSIFNTLQTSLDWIVSQNTATKAYNTLPTHKNKNKTSQISPRIADWLFSRSILTYPKLSSLCLPTNPIIGGTEQKHMQNILAQMQPNHKLRNPEFAPPVHHSTQISNQSPLHNPTGIASHNFSSSSSSSSRLQICWDTVKDFSPYMCLRWWNFVPSLLAG